VSRPALPLRRSERAKLDGEVTYLMHRFEALTNAVGIRGGAADNAHDCRMHTWPYLPDVQVGNRRVARLFHQFPDLRSNLLVGRLQQAHDRLDANAQGHQRQDQRRGKTAQIADLAGAEADAWRRA